MVGWPALMERSQSQAGVRNSFVERDSKLKVKTIRGTAVSDEEEGQGMPRSPRVGPYGETCCMVHLSVPSGDPQPCLPGPTALGDGS